MQPLGIIISEAEKAFSVYFPSQRMTVFRLRKNSGKDFDFAKPAAESYHYVIVLSKMNSN